MVSRATLWRRRKQFQEQLCQLLATKNSSFDENWTDPTSLDLSNSKADADLLTRTPTVNVNETEPNLYTYPVDDNDDNEFEDESDQLVNHTWLDDGLNDVDPWKNIELEPAFQYPMEEDESSFHQIDSNPTEKEIAAALVLLKIRHRASNKFMDDLCKFIKYLKTPNCPANFSRVKHLFLSEFSQLPSLMITYMCQVCCEISLSLDHCNNSSCTQHSSFTKSPFQYLRLPILPQLRDILYNTCSINFEQQQKFSPNIDILNDIYDGKAYQHIIKKQQGKEFLTFLMNVDGVQVSNNSTTSLWIFTLVINEIKRTERFKMKNIVIGGIVSVPCKPNHVQMQSLLSPMIDELLLLERGIFVELKNFDYHITKYLKCFLIASCCDKPAQSLVQGISSPIGAFGCGACQIKGVTVVINSKSRKKIRVFPLVPTHQQQPCLRTNKTYDKFIKILTKNNSSNYNELRDRCRGHVSPCVLRELTYFDVGNSFLSDSLHNIYHGVVKRLLRLWFDKKYRKEPWSIYGKESIVNRYLSSIKYPSTTVRIPRSLSKYEQYKANETRAILLFGFSGFCSVLPLKYAKHFLLLVVAIHIAESRRIHTTQIEDVRLLLDQFLQQFPILYTSRNNSQAVHSLHHIARSISEYGPLSNYSTFNFENILGLITSTVHSTRRHSYEIYNNIKLLRLAYIELDRPTFNKNLKQMISIAQSSKPMVSTNKDNNHEKFRFLHEDKNENTLKDLQEILRQTDMKLFKTCFIHTNRFITIQYCSTTQRNDSCLLFLHGGKPCIGFIQNIIQIRHKELLLRICKVNIKDRLSLVFSNKKLSCPNVFYGDLDMSNNSIFIKSEAVIEKIIHVYNTQLKCYIFCRVPNLCESS